MRVRVKVGGEGGGRGLGSEGAMRSRADHVAGRVKVDGEERLEDVHRAKPDDGEVEPEARAEHGVDRMRWLQHLAHLGVKW